MTPANPTAEPLKSATSSRARQEPPEASSCPTGGGCDGPGLCPGVALLLAYLAGGSVALLTGHDWLGWAVGAPVGLVLATGAWKYLPKRRRATARR